MEVCMGDEEATVKRLIVIVHYLFTHSFFYIVNFFKALLEFSLEAILRASLKLQQISILFLQLNSTSVGDNKDGKSLR